MKIPFTNIDGHNVVSALVEVPDQILNKFPVAHIDNENIIDIPHVRANSFTRVFGDAAVYFPDEHKLPIPEAESKGIYIDIPVNSQIDTDTIMNIFNKTGFVFRCTTEDILLKLGFQKRGPVQWYSILFGDDRSDNWMYFDPATDSLDTLLPKLYRSGFAKGQRKVRFDIKKALDISLI